MNFSSRLIILNATKVGENSLVIHTLGPVFGRRSFITAVGRKTSMALFLPLNVLDAEVVENPKSDLWRVRNLKALYPLNGIRGNVYKNSMTLFMSEVLYRAVKDGCDEDGLYEWCEKSILTLDSLEGDFANYHLRFLMEFASVLGFSPAVGNLLPFADGCLKEITDLLSADFPRFMLYPLNGEARNAIAASLLKYIGYHAESSMDVRSLSVLRELYKN